MAYLQYAKPEDSVARTIARVRLFLGLGVLGGTALAFLAGLLVARRAMRPISGLTHVARQEVRRQGYRAIAVIAGEQGAPQEFGGGDIGRW